MSDYQMIVLGGGPGGYAAAFYAADRGLKTAIVEKDAVLGGVCLNVGCIPSKALLHLAALKEEALQVSAHGLNLGAPSWDLAKLRAYKESVIAKMTGGLKQLAAARKVDVLRGTGSLTGPNALTVVHEGAERAVTFDHLILATGSRPAVPKAFALGSDRVMDSTGALALRDIPGDLLVVGGGVIGLEMGQVYASLGSRVTVVEALPHLANGCDRDLFKPLEQKLTKQFAAVHVGAKVETLALAGDKVKVRFAPADGPAVEAAYDRVLLSMGRRPNSENLGLDKAGVTVDERGFVVTDEQRRTAARHIFAIGDLVGNPMLAHKASAEARVAVDAALGEKTVWDKKVIPAVIYTDPEVAWAGLTETEAKEKGVAVKIGKFPWAALGRATAMGKPEGLTKILVDPETERVLGVGMCGYGAGEMIAAGALAVEMAATQADLALTVHAHPTLSESLLEAAESLHGLATHIFAPKKAAHGSGRELTLDAR